MQVYFESSVQFARDVTEHEAEEENSEEIVSVKLLQSKLCKTRTKPSIVKLYTNNVARFLHND